MPSTHIPCAGASQVRSPYGVEPFSYYSVCETHSSSRPAIMCCLSVFPLPWALSRTDDWRRIMLRCPIPCMLVGNKANPPGHEPSGARISGPSLAARKLHPVISCAVSYIRSTSKSPRPHPCHHSAGPLRPSAIHSRRHRSQKPLSPQGFSGCPFPVPRSPALFLPLALGPLSPMMRTECSSVSNALWNFSYYLAARSPDLQIVA